MITRRKRSWPEAQSLPMLLLVREVAELLHVHTNTVRNWSDQGVLRAYRVGPRRDRRFRREDVLAFLQQAPESFTSLKLRTRKSGDGKGKGNGNGEAIPVGQGLHHRRKK